MGSSRASKEQLYKNGTCNTRKRNTFADGGETHSMETPKKGALHKDLKMPNDQKKPKGGR